MEVDSTAPRFMSATYQTDKVWHICHIFAGNVIRVVQGLDSTTFAMFSSKFSVRPSGFGSLSRDATNAPNKAGKLVWYTWPLFAIPD